MKYIVAVSGGLDSVALLDMLAALRNRTTGLELVIAHVDHGIRPDSGEDADHVRRLADNYQLPYELVRLELGPNASEETARDARYAALEGIRAHHHASGVITAHHEDDLLETIILNFQRGTGWRGLASLRTVPTRLRPLLDLPKASIARYALDHNLVWREDSTNDDVTYTRNYIRHGVLPKLDAASRKKLAKLAQSQRAVREEIEREVARVLTNIRDDDGILRHQLIMMPDAVALEVLRAATEGRHEPFQLRRLLHFAKTGRPGAMLHLGKGRNAFLTRQRLVV